MPVGQGLPRGNREPVVIEDSDDELKKTGSCPQSIMSSPLAARSSTAAVKVEDALEDRSSDTETSLYGKGSTSYSNGTNTRNGTNRNNARKSIADIGLQHKANMTTLANLQQLDISHVAPLPEVVLVGDQSAGKSSLMSGLSEVSLPRKAGTCTRVPTRIRLSRSEESTSISISLQLDYEYNPPANGGPINKGCVTETQPFYPWTRKPAGQSITKPFKTINDTSNFQDVISWAQIAILNPSHPPELYVPGEGFMATGQKRDKAWENREAQFSPNIISVEIKGPNMPDFSFYDLPGVFVTPENEGEEYLVEVVRNLSKRYIQKPEATIMCAFSMDSDPELSNSFALIREARATHRTAGVITKADRLPHTAECVSMWHSILSGERHKLGFGYFVTARPQGDNEDVWEDLFFRGDSSTWPRQFAAFEDHCGVAVLKEFVSKRLDNAFVNSLPIIRHEIEKRLSKLRDQLAQLPELPRNVELEVSQCLDHFLREVKDGVNHPEFRGRWKELSSQFHKCIFGLKPRYIMTVKSETAFAKKSVFSKQVSSMDTIEISSSDDQPAQTPSKRSRASDNFLVTPSLKRQKTERTPVKDEFRSPNTPSIANAPMIDPNYPFKHFAQRACKTNLEDIRREIEAMTDIGVRNHTPFTVIEHLALRSMKQWDGPMVTFLEKTVELLQDLINDTLQQSLGMFQKRLIFSESMQCLEDFVQRERIRQLAALTDLYSSETYRVNSINTEAWERHKTEEGKHIQRARIICRLKAAGIIEPQGTPLARMSDAEEAKFLQDSRNKMGADSFEREIEVAAEVRGYYLTAANRFVDNVNVSIDYHLFRKIKEQLELRDHLMQGLGLQNPTDENAYRKLMNENNHTARKRDQIKSEMKNFETAMASITGLQVSDATSGSERGSVLFN